MISLVSLDLSNNQFEGEILKSLSNNLVYLDLFVIQLHGSIPNTFGNMIFLKDLNLSSNQLHGEIPKSFRNLCSLRLLELYPSHLSYILSSLDHIPLTIYFIPQHERS